jgi:hypothetical protein
LLFDQVSPDALTVLLGMATALLWWLTRPVERDVFWDLEKVRASPGFARTRRKGRQLWSAAIDRRFPFFSFSPVLEEKEKNQSGDQSPHSKVFAGGSSSLLDSRA